MRICTDSGRATILLEKTQRTPDLELDGLSENHRGRKPNAQSIAAVQSQLHLRMASAEWCRPALASPLVDRRAKIQQAAALLVRRAGSKSNSCAGHRFAAGPADGRHRLWQAFGCHGPRQLLPARGTARNSFGARGNTQRSLPLATGAKPEPPRHSTAHQSNSPNGKVPGRL